MTTYKDIFIKLLLFILFYKLTYYTGEIAFLQNNALIQILLVVIIFSIYLVVLKKLNDRKRVSEYLKQSLTDAKNYIIISERPLTLKEQYQNFEFEFGATINGISLDFLRFKSRMKRHFVVRNEKEHDFELVVEIIQTWGDKIKYDIKHTSRIRN